MKAITTAQVQQFHTLAAKLTPRHWPSLDPSDVAQDALLRRLKDEQRLGDEAKPLTEDVIVRYIRSAGFDALAAVDPLTRDERATLRGARATDPMATERQLQERTGLEAATIARGLGGAVPLEEWDGAETTEDAFETRELAYLHYDQQVVWDEIARARAGEAVELGDAHLMELRIATKIDSRGRESREVQMPEIAALFGVDETTIRRRLKALAEAIRSHRAEVFASVTEADARILA